ncbi:MAG: extracellular solute-binding protein [Pseudomonadota bacterium]
MHTSFACWFGHASYVMAPHVSACPTHAASKLDRIRRRVRTVLVAAAAAIAVLGAPLSSPALAEPSHGLSAFGDLKYPADFSHFDYVNPDAPKGGRLALVGTRGLTTFDSFNGYILKGDAAQGLSTLFEGFSLIFDTLMTRATDEADAVYGLVAKTADVAPDRRSVVFEMRPEARFADGTALTADDVVFSFDILKDKGHPIYKTILRDVAKAEALDRHRVRYTFQGEQLRDLPATVATLPIFSRAYYANRDFSATTLEPPLGSGPYTLTKWRQGRSVTYERRADYWGRDLPVNRGRWNFDTVRFEYFRDRTAALESLKAGDYDLREEFTSKDWATAYDIPQVRSGKMKLTTLRDERPSGAQGFFINTRLKKFSDIRVRKALDLAFDFEWTNKNLFYGLYTRTASYFENSPLKAEGAPNEAERRALEAAGITASGPADKRGILTSAPYASSQSDASGLDRKRLREAIALLEEAGYKRKGDQRVHADGTVLDVEFLTFAPSFHRIIQPYINSLKRIGVSARIRQVDPAQFERRTKSFDFDIVTRRFVMGLTPSTGMRNYLSSAAARTEGSSNLAGISDPTIDTLVEMAISAGTRDELGVVVRALDRTLRAGHYWVPHWYKAAHNIAHWDRFARPETKPRYADGVIDTWWFDADKAAALKQ